MRRLLRYLLPPVLFIAGLAAGSWFSIGRRAAAFAAGVESRLTEAMPRRLETMPAPMAGRAFATDDEMLTAIMSAVVEEEPLLRAHRLGDLLGRLNSAELGALFARALQMDDLERR